MNIKYRIIEVYEAEHSFVVRYYTDLITEEMLASQFEADGVIKIDYYTGKPARCRTDYSITLYDENASEEDIDKIIRSHAPVDWLRIQESNLGRNTDTMTIAIARARAKIHIEHEFTHEPKPNLNMLSDAEFEAIMAKFKKKNA